MSVIEQRIRRMTLNVEDGSLEVETLDGVVHQTPSPSTSDQAEDYRKLTYVPGTRTVTMEPRNSDPFEVEVFDGGDLRERRAGRSTIYLDQNKWILLAQAVHAPERVDAAELDAARQLIHLAQQRQVILLVSSGHYIETTQTDEAWRNNLAPLILRLSRGWLLADPLVVRRAELRVLFEHRTRRASGMSFDAITLDPSHLYSQPVRDRPLGDASWPQEVRILTEALSGLAACHAVLLENEALHGAEGEERARGWAQFHQDLADLLSANRAARERSRSVILAHLVRDLATEITLAAAASGMTDRDLERWLQDDVEADIASLPYLGRLLDVTHARVRDANDRWETNDFVDMMYLPCATGYADFVVAEKKARHYLRLVGRDRSDGATVVSRIADVVEALDGRLPG